MVGIYSQTTVEEHECRALIGRYGSPLNNYNRLFSYGGLTNVEIFSLSLWQEKFDHFVCLPTKQNVELRIQNQIRSSGAMFWLLFGTSMDNGLQTWPKFIFLYELRSFFMICSVHKSFFDHCYADSVRFAASLSKIFLLVVFFGLVNASITLNFLY